MMTKNSMSTKELKLSFLRGSLNVDYPVLLDGVSVFGPVTVGRHSYMNGGMIRSNTSIGRYCSFGRNITISAGDHPLDALTTHPVAYESANGVKAAKETKRNAKHPNTVIGHDVWMGDNVVILSGVHIGTGAAIGSNAVVTKDVAPYEIVGGVPARVIRRRFDDDVCEALLQSKWWTLSKESVRMLNVNDIYSCIATVPELLEKYGPEPEDFVLVEASPPMTHAEP